MKTILNALFILLLSTSMLAQERSFGSLPLVNKSGGILSKDAPVSKDSPEYQEVLVIYNKLVEARGDFRFPVPDLEMWTTTNNGAKIVYGDLKIVLEKKAYDVCKTFGEDSEAAIAFLLGHELTHYYEKHAWRSNFTETYKDLEVDISIDTLNDEAADETEADYLGGFLAYTAGYGLFDKGDEVIEKMYREYTIPPNGEGYPSLNDRKVLSKATAERVKRLVEVFDMANMLTAIGKYDEAYKYYRKVLFEYQSRELYNNLGVTACLEAMSMFNPAQLKYYYPIELDLTSSGSKGNDGAVDAKSKLLRQAILHFDAAISLDPSYSPAYLNKACALALLNDDKRAAFYAEQEGLPLALANGDEKTTTDLNVLLGILAAKSGDTDKAKEMFKKAMDAGSVSGMLNLKAMDPTAVTEEPLEDINSRIPKKEKIDDQTIQDVMDDAGYDENLSVWIGNDLQFHQNPVQGENSSLWISQNGQTGDITYFHVTKEGYAETTALGAKLNQSTPEEVIKMYRSTVLSSMTEEERRKYPDGSKTIESPLGVILVYPKMIFIFGKGNKLERWINYFVEE